MFGGLWLMPVRFSKSIFGATELMQVQKEAQVQKDEIPESYVHAYVQRLETLIAEAEALRRCNVATTALSTVAALCSQTAPAAAPAPAAALPDPPPCSTSPDQT
jgi:hypothetical protein